MGFYDAKRIIRESAPLIALLVGFQMISGQILDSNLDLNDSDEFTS